MERNLHVQASHKELSPELKAIFREPYEKALHDRDNHVWYTHWQVVAKDENIIVGGMTFKGPPNSDGEVEIGYGTEEEYQNRGYMTEALKGMIQWAFTQKNLKSVIAETEKGNAPSKRVLEKVGMKMYRETDDCYWYRIDKR